MCKGFGAADSRISSSRIALFVCVCFLFRFFFSMLLLTVNESRFACCLLGFRGKPATWIGCLSFQNNTNCFCFTWFSQSANKPKSVACFPTTGLQNSTSTFRIALCSLTQRYLKSWHRSVAVAFALHIVCDFNKKIFLRFFMKRSKLNTRIREENSTEYSLQLRFFFFCCCFRALSGLISFRVCCFSCYLSL